MLLSLQGGRAEWVRWSGLDIRRRLTLVTEPLAAIPGAKAFTPSGPILLPDRLSLVSERLKRKASARASTPLISFPNVVSPLSANLQHETQELVCSAKAHELGWSSSKRGQAYDKLANEPLKRTWSATALAPSAPRLQDARPSLFIWSIFLKMLTRVRAASLSIEL
jgi:hypothetical protein